MNTTVEIFMEKETSDFIYDNEKLENWKTKVGELGLEGQLKLSEPEKSPVPFVFMKRSMEAMFEVLCPTRSEVKKYDKTPIPLEALGLIALSEKESYFERIEIWYDDQLPDPILVGKRSGDLYLMCRWGAEKQDFDQLYVSAKKRLMGTIKSDLDEMLAIAKENLSKIEVLATKKLRGDWVSWRY